MTEDEFWECTPKKFYLLHSVFIEENKRMYGAEKEEKEDYIDNII